MNLLFVDQFTDLGGAQLCLLDLLPEVQARGWKAVVAAPGDGPLLSRASQLGAPVQRLPSHIYTRGRKTASDIVAFASDLLPSANVLHGLARQYAAGVIYVNGPRMLMPAACAARRNVPIVYHCHSVVPPLYSGLVSRCLAYAGATVIANSQFTAASLSVATTPRIIYNGVADCARPRAKRERPRVGIIGRIERAKGQLEFVRAARVLVDRGCPYDFEVCGTTVDEDGTAYERAVRQTADGLPVEFSGWSDNVAAALARMDLLIVPSIGHEATTRVIFEAYSAGVPVVASRTGGIPEVVVNGETGILVDEPGPSQLANAVDRLLSGDGRERIAITRAARAAWESRFTVERYRREILNLVARCRRDFERLQQPPEH
jgi:glycosyltransferase involved in cell wall biosynthesis